MTLKQIEFLREIVRQSMNMSAAALVLGASQPAMSRQIQELERELGTALLVRRRNRIVSLTGVGRAVLEAAERLLTESENIQLIAAEARRSGGRLVVATSHLHARYTLLNPFRRLHALHPEVELLLRQSTSGEVSGLVATGAADIGVRTGNDDVDREVSSSRRVAVLKGKVIRRSAIYPTGHPLSQCDHLTLGELGSFPLIGYGASSPTGRDIAGAFAAAGVTPNFVVRASDSDVIKMYVAQGLGVGIVPTMCLEHAVQPGLASVEVTGLLPRARTVVTLRADRYLRRHVVTFIRMIAPAWDRARIQGALDQA